MEVVRVHKIRLETNRLVLRELEEKDAKFLVKGLAPIEVTKYLVLVPHPYALTDAEWFINKTMSEQNAESRTGYPLAITLKSEVCVA